MELVIALIGLVGTVLTGGAVTELVKRHNLRSNILADLQILENLPESATKDKLYDTVTKRVWTTTITPVR
jgi:hypothetical protein